MLLRCFVTLLLAATAALPAQAQQTVSDPPVGSLYQRLGGYDRIAAVVDDFFARFGADAELTPFLGGINAAEGARIRQHFIDFVCANTGGPCAYHGRSMKAAHEGFGITDRHFDRVVAHFTAALQAQQVLQSASAEFLALLQGLRADIVQKR